MRRLTTLLTTAALFVGLSGIAQATTLSGGPLLVDADNLGGSQVLCTLINLGPKDIKNVVGRATITVQGVVTVNQATVKPGEFFTVNNVNDTVNAQLGWCEFKFRGWKKNVRGTLCVIFGANRCADSVPLQ